MKKVIVSVMLLLPVLAFAQQDMMKKMLAMQECMQDIDQAELRQLEQKAKRFEAELRSLCASGKQQQAQSQALVFGKEVVNSKALAKVRECSSIMEGIMPQIPAYSNLEKDYANMNVCEEM